MRDFLMCLSSYFLVQGLFYIFAQSQIIKLADGIKTNPKFVKKVGIIFAIVGIILGLIVR
jgi:hypothetical protein